MEAEYSFGTSKQTLLGIIFQNTIIVTLHIHT